jgi:MFS family permease
MTLQGLGQALTLPGVMSGLSLSVDEDEQGAVAGLNSSSQALARTLGPVLGTGLYQLRPELPYLFGAALLVCVLGFLMASRNALALRLQAP